MFVSKFPVVQIGRVHRVSMYGTYSKFPSNKAVLERLQGRPVPDSEYQLIYKAVAGFQLNSRLPINMFDQCFSKLEGAGSLRRFVLNLLSFNQFRGDLENVDPEAFLRVSCEVSNNPSLLLTPQINPDIYYRDSIERIPGVIFAGNICPRLTVYERMWSREMFLDSKDNGGSVDFWSIVSSVKEVDVSVACYLYHQIAKHPDYSGYDPFRMAVLLASAYSSDSLQSNVIATLDCISEVIPDERSSMEGISQFSDFSSPSFLDLLRVSEGILGNIRKGISRKQAYNLIESVSKLPIDGDYGVALEFLGSVICGDRTGAFDIERLSESIALLARYLNQLQLYPNSEVMKDVFLLALESHSLRDKHNVSKDEPFDFQSSIMDSSFFSITPISSPIDMIEISEVPNSEILKSQFRGLSDSDIASLLEAFDFFNQVSCKPISVVEFSSIIKEVGDIDFFKFSASLKVFCDICDGDIRLALDRALDFSRI